MGMDKRMNGFQVGISCGSCMPGHCSNGGENELLDGQQKSIIESIVLRPVS